MHSMLASVVLSPIVLVAPVGADSPKPAPAAPGPAARRAAAMTFDAARKQILLFGGAPDDATLWAFDGKIWRALATSGPTARQQPILIDDPVRKRVVLIGGRHGDAPDAPADDDTWEWDGKSWTRAAEHGPGARVHPACVRDAKRGRIVVQGGVDPATGKDRADAFEWDGKAWTKSDAPALPANFAPTLIEDAAGKRTLLVAVDETTLHAKTFARPDGAGGAWTALAGDGPPFIPGGVVAMDAGQLLAFGGADPKGGKDVVDATWRFDGKTWSAVDVHGPSARTGHAMAWDAARKRVVLFGGEDGKQTLGDTWEFDGKKWSKVGG